jgi:hypothetical protein
MNSIVVFLGVGGWTNPSCIRLFAVWLCVYVWLTDANTSSGEPCPFGTFSYDTSCYWFERTTPMTWTQAEAYCRDNGTTMWVPNSVDEWVCGAYVCAHTRPAQDTVRYQTTVSRRTWLGGKADDSVDTTPLFKWNDGESGMSEHDL